MKGAGAEEIRGGIKWAIDGGVGKIVAAGSVGYGGGGTGGGRRRGILRHPLGGKGLGMEGGGSGGGEKLRQGEKQVSLIVKSSRNEKPLDESEKSRGTS